MRKLAIIAALIAAISISGNAQGLIFIDNTDNSNTSSTATSNGLVFVTLSPVYRDLALETNSFSIAVYAGPSSNSLSPIATLLGYEGQLYSGAQVGPGLFFDASGTTYAVPGVPAGDTAWIRIEAWEGPYTSAELAFMDGANVGSVTFPNPTVVPPYPTPDLTGMPALYLEPDYITLAIFQAGPYSRTNLAGTTATFSVVVTDVWGNPQPGDIQWLRNGTNLVDGGNISGVTSDTLTISNVSDADAGQYYATANWGEPTHSSTATLTVIDPPTLALQFNDGQPRLTLTGAPNHSFLVQYSTDLATTNWVNLFSVTLQNASPIQFTDPGGAGQTARFYRAIMQ